MSRGASLGGGAATLILTRIALRRLVRSRTPWVAALLAVGPIIFTAVVARQRDLAAWKAAYEMLVVFMVVVPPLLVAAAISEEVEERTYTYLWSRPLPRWAMVAGKVLAGWPLAAAILGLASLACFQLALGGEAGQHGDALARGLVACVVGVLGVSLVSAGMAALAPMLAQRLTYAYLVLDLGLGTIPFSLANLSITYQIRQMAGVTRRGDSLIAGALWCLGIGAVFLAVGLLRLRRAEYADDR